MALRAVRCGWMGSLDGLLRLSRLLGRQQCRLTICIKVDELTNSIRQQDPNIYSDTKASCLV